MPTLGHWQSASKRPRSALVRSGRGRCPPGRDAPTPGRAPADSTVASVTPRQAWLTYPQNVTHCASPRHSQMSPGGIFSHQLVQDQQHASSG